MSAYDGDEANEVLQSLYEAMGAPPVDANLSQFAPSSRARVLQSMADGLLVIDAGIMHIARLIPEYCGETFAEVIEFRPELLVISKDEDGNESANIQRCSVEG